jgi:D-alanine--poly(phosphoribitol) ligase subunit 1
VAVTAIAITSEVLSQYDRLPIGWLKPDTIAQVVNADAAQVPAETAGQLLISGPSVSKGYLNNPGKTTAAFFEQDGTRYYRTGDLVTQTAEGLLFYKGRTDFQVKLHGYRIELEEIDQHLNQLPQVKQACTVPRYNKFHQVTQLIAYVVPEAGLPEKAAALSATLKEALLVNTMAYMLPQRFVYQTQLPLSVNGKVDRKALIQEVNQNA